MTSKYYDRQGNELADNMAGIMEWGKLREDPNYKRIAETTLPDGTWISTVWIGIDHQFGKGPPLIFESMAFESKDNLDECECDRYSTEAEALAGHEAMVKRMEEERS